MAYGRAAACAEASAHVLRHASETFAPAGEAVPFVHRLQDGAQEHFGNGVDFGNRSVEQLDALAFGFVFEQDSDMPAAREARGVQQKQGVPVACVGSQAGDQFLKSWTILIFARFNDIGELGNNRQAAFSGEFFQLAPLCVDGDVGSVLTGSQVECGLFLGDCLGHDR